MITGPLYKGIYEHLNKQALLSNFSYTVETMERCCFSGSAVCESFRASTLQSTDPVNLFVFLIASQAAHFFRGNLRTEKTIIMEGKKKVKDAYLL